MNIQESLAHLFLYISSKEYREMDKKRNNEEWRLLHKNTLEGMEAERGLYRILNV